MVCCSVKKSAESIEDSLPIPLSFIPPGLKYFQLKILIISFLPKGIVRSRTSQQFVQTVPALSCFATLFARLIFSDHKVAQSPYFVSFARSIASFSVANLETTVTGPKISSLNFWWKIEGWKKWIYLPSRARSVYPLTRPLRRILRISTD